MLVGWITRSVYASFVDHEPSFFTWLQTSNYVSCSQVMRYLILQMDRLGLTLSDDTIPHDIFNDYYEQYNRNQTAINILSRAISISYGSSFEIFR